MKVLKETLAGTVVLTLKGEFDSFVTSAFSNEIGHVLEDGSARIVLNMRLVKFVNSTALGAMIKARKQCRAAGGDLVVSQPSAAVREAMESLGLDRLFSIFDDDDAALTSLEGGAGIALEGESESAVMIHVPESNRPHVARIRRLDNDAIECRLTGAVGKLVTGREVRLKFRLPLYRKEFFELGARIEQIQSGDDGTSMLLRFTQVNEADKSDIARFVADMSELRKAARGNG